MKFSLTDWFSSCSGNVPSEEHAELPAAPVAPNPLSGFPARPPASAPPAAPAAAPPNFGYPWPPKHSHVTVSGAPLVATPAAAPAAAPPPSLCEPDKLFEYNGKWGRRSRVDTLDFDEAETFEIRNDVYSSEHSCKIIRRKKVRCKFRDGWTDWQVIGEEVDYAL